MLVILSHSTADYPNLDQLRLAKMDKELRENILKSAKQSYAPAEVRAVDFLELSLIATESIWPCSEWVSIVIMPLYTVIVMEISIWIPFEFFRKEFT